MSLGILALTLTTLAPQWAFILLYTFTTSWWDSHLGRAVFIKGWGLALLCLSAMTTAYLGYGTPVATAVRWAVWVLVPLGIWWQFIAFLLVRQDARRARRAEAFPPTHSS